MDAFGEPTRAPGPFFAAFLLRVLRVLRGEEAFPAVLSELGVLGGKNDLKSYRSGREGA